jgi:hypothetical protein
MLIYDTRYRSLTIQVVVFFLVMAGAAWLVDNTIQNLEALGKDFNFAFLWHARAMTSASACRIHQRQHAWPRAAGRPSEHAAGGRAGLHGGDRAGRADRRSAPVEELDRRPADDRSMSRSSATCRCCCGSC